MRTTNKSYIASTLTLGMIAAVTLVSMARPATAQDGFRGAIGGPSDIQSPLAPNASWSEIDRKPHIDDLRPGIYVWRDRDDIYVALKAPDGEWANRIEGQAYAPFGGLSHEGNYGDGAQGRIEQVTSNRVHFEVDSGEGINGVKFHVDSGHRIVLELRADGTPTDRILLGQYHVRASQVLW